MSITALLTIYKGVVVIKGSWKSFFQLPGGEGWIFFSGRLQCIAMTPSLPSGTISDETLSLKIKNWNKGEFFYFGRLLFFFRPPAYFPFSSPLCSHRGRNTRLYWSALPIGLRFPVLMELPLLLPPPACSGPHRYLAGVSVWAEAERERKKWHFPHVLKCLNSTVSPGAGPEDQRSRAWQKRSETVLL